MCGCRGRHSGWALGLHVPTELPHGHWKHWPRGQEASACVPCPRGFSLLPPPPLQSERFGSQRGFLESQMSRNALVCIRVTANRRSQAVSPVTVAGGRVAVGGQCRR